MSERSKLDPTHIAQLTFDPISESTKVKLQDTEIDMELSADDGDSVTSHPVKLIASVLGCDLDDNMLDIIPALDCSSLGKVRVDIDGSGNVNVLVSPTDAGDYFYSVGGSGAILDICARRIKVKSLNVVGDVHLVGKS
jgi:hypothetical protein